MRPTCMCNLSLDKVRLRIFECGCQTSRLYSTSVHSEPKGLSAGECPGFMSRFYLPINLRVKNFILILSFETSIKWLGRMMILLSFGSLSNNGPKVRFSLCSCELSIFFPTQCSLQWASFALSSNNPNLVGLPRTENNVGIRSGFCCQVWLMFKHFPLFSCQVKVMQQQFILLQNATCAFFTGDYARLDQCIKLFHVKLLPSTIPGHLPGSTDSVIALQALPLTSDLASPSKEVSPQFSWFILAGIPDPGQSVGVVCFCLCVCLLIWIEY